MKITENKSNFGFMDPNNVKPSNIIKEGEGKLAVCVPTYERSEVIEELLSMCLGVYKKYNYDLYIYDSSRDCKTKDIVNKWQKLFSNLYYVRLPSDLHSNMKVYKIFQQYAMRKNYKYIWVCSDAIRFREDVLYNLSSLLDKDYDMIVVNYRDLNHVGTRCYKNKLHFFRDIAYHLTLYGAALLKCDSMLSNVDWNYYIEKYNVPTRVNHSHLGFYFEKILSMPDFTAYHVSVPVTTLYVSALRPSSGWLKDTFYVWGICFPETIEVLPSYYNYYKKQVIKESNVLGDIFNYNNMVRLRILNIYTLDIFNEFKSKWENLTTLSEKTLYKIATLPRFCLFNPPSFIKDMKIKKYLWHLKKFVKNKKELYIYGAGKIASYYADYFDCFSIPYKGFIVTNKSNNPSEFMDHPVFALDDVDLNQFGVGVVLALGRKNTEEVMSIPQLRKADDKVFFAFFNSGK